MSRLPCSSSDLQGSQGNQNSYKRGTAPYSYTQHLTPSITDFYPTEIPRCA